MQPQTSQLTVKKRQGSNQYYTEVLAEGVLPLQMMLIPAGTFMMGQTEEEKAELIRQVGEEDYQKYYARELPRHSVTVPLFFMGKYPITQAQWRVVAGLPQVNRALESDPSRFKGDNRPVEQVSWHEAVEFCDRLTLHTDRQYRLPTEAEWEYGCRASPIQTSGTPGSGEVRRAGTTTPFHFGETLSTDYANYNGADERYGAYGPGRRGEYREETTPVGHFEGANEYGLCDMHGNVLEWCQDVWHDNYVDAPDDGSAWVEGGNSSYRVLRGGAWDNGPRDCRSAYRSYYNPDFHINGFGFRVCCAAPRTV